MQEARWKKRKTKCEILKWELPFEIKAKSQKKK